jgi:hypothetical protein
VTRLKGNEDGRVAIRGAGAFAFNAENDYHSHG